MDLDREHETLPFWEDAATGAVDFALEAAVFDEVRGVVVVPDSSGDHRMAKACRTPEELQDTLEELYNEQWYANVPFESGEALYEGDASGYVSGAIDEERIQAFFSQYGREPSGERIVAATDLLDAEGARTVRIDIEEINDELISFLAKHPEYLRELKPRRFEELVAELFKTKGYEVELTPRTRDGGLDIVAIRRDELGAALTIIECKRYAADKKVGVGIVRALYGVVGEKSATKGLIATTSFFTRDAKALHDKLRYRIALADYDAMCVFLTEWKNRARA